ncbi:hypothetical protein B0H14DRAFT_2354667, partial [Mycena olivaceomarginata]
PDISSSRLSGHIYWTNMGTSASDGFLSRSNIDRSNITILVPPGATDTPKQLVLYTEREYLYWCDREGGKIQRCKLDGSHIQTLYISVSTLEEHKDQRTWCVGIALDPARGLLYWMQKVNSKGSNGRIFRANIDPPASADPTRRMDVRITPLAPGATPHGLSRELIIAERFHETIGLTVDPVGKKIYIADLLGSLWVTNLDGSHKAVILCDAGNFTGIMFHPAKSV